MLLPTIKLNIQMDQTDGLLQDMLSQRIRNTPLGHEYTDVLQMREKEGTQASLEVQSAGRRSIVVEQGDVACSRGT